MSRRNRGFVDAVESLNAKGDAEVLLRKMGRVRLWMRVKLLSSLSIVTKNKNMADCMSTEDALESP